MIQSVLKLWSGALYLVDAILWRVFAFLVFLFYLTIAVTILCGMMAAMIFISLFIIEYLI